MVVFAGDAGAGSKYTSWLHRAAPNVLLSASGMGDHKATGAWLHVTVNAAAAANATADWPVVVRPQSLVEWTVRQERHVF